jgi:hypothetical protein
LQYDKIKIGGKMRMFFEVQKNWEVTNPIYNALMGPETRVFPVVEFAINCKIFLVDITVEDQEGAILTRQFIFGSVSDALELMGRREIKHSAISLLSRRCDNDGRYDISDLIEISEGKDTCGQTSYILSCENGKKYVDSPLANCENELTECKTIYSKSGKMS